MSMNFEASAVHCPSLKARAHDKRYLIHYGDYSITAEVI